MGLKFCLRQLNGTGKRVIYTHVGKMRGTLLKGGMIISEDETKSYTGGEKPPTAGSKKSIENKPSRSRNESQTAVQRLAGSKKHQGGGKRLRLV